LLRLNRNKRPFRAQPPAAPAHDSTPSFQASLLHFSPQTLHHLLALQRLTTRSRTDDHTVLKCALSFLFFGRKLVQSLNVHR
jgi:hypothetical protein